MGAFFLSVTTPEIVCAADGIAKTRISRKQAKKTAGWFRSNLYSFLIFPLADTCLFYHRFSDCQFFNSIAFNLETDSCRLGRGNRSFRRNFDLRRDYVFVPVAFARRNVARKSVA